jgi:hypothetical protein
MNQSRTYRTYPQAGRSSFSSQNSAESPFRFVGFIGGLFMSLRTAGITNGQVKPCLNSQGGIFPCPRHSGLIEKEWGKIVKMKCENRKSHEIPPRVQVNLAHSPKVERSAGEGEIDRVNRKVDYNPSKRKKR